MTNIHFHLYLQTGRGTQGSDGIENLEPKQSFRRLALSLLVVAAFPLKKSIGGKPLESLTAFRNDQKRLGVFLKSPIRPTRYDLYLEAAKSLKTFRLDRKSDSFSGVGLRFFLI